MSPLEQVEAAEREALACMKMHGRPCSLCVDKLARAHRRVVLSALSYILVALMSVALIWAVIAAVIGGFQPPTVTDVQLPTR